MPQIDREEEIKRLWKEIENRADHARSLREWIDELSEERNTLKAELARAKTDRDSKWAAATRLAQQFGDAEVKFEGLLKERDELAAANRKLEEDMADVRDWPCEGYDCKTRFGNLLDYDHEFNQTQGLGRWFCGECQEQTVQHMRDAVAAQGASGIAELGARNDLRSLERLYARAIDAQVTAEKARDDARAECQSLLEKLRAKS